MSLVGGVLYQLCTTVHCVSALIVMIDQNLFVGYDKTSQTTLQVPSEISARGDDQDTEIPEGI